MQQRQFAFGYLLIGAKTRWALALEQGLRALAPKGLDQIHIVLCDTHYVKRKWDRESDQVASCQRVRVADIEQVASMPRMLLQNSALVQVEPGVAGLLRTDHRAAFGE